jgi:CRISPR-associated protein Cmr6
MVEQGLRQRHLQQGDFCHSAEKQGWTVLVFHARLKSPYISGLGMAHPTETGLVLDYTLGVPYIPAAGQKGALRLAYIFNELRDDSGTWLPKEQLGCENEEVSWQEDDAFRTLFGFSDAQHSLGGRLLILDAYPLRQPELIEDILNPHYPDYYRSQGQDRGPTEDQNPTPIKFLAVDEGQEFVFRFLLRSGFSAAPSVNVEVLSTKIRQAIKVTLTEEGLGAKTALGYGRFEILNEQEEPEIVQQWLAEQKMKKFPWLPLVAKIEKVDNWGDLKQLVLDNEEISKYRDIAELSNAVRDAANRVVEKNPKKWTAERDRLVAEWLKDSPVSWLPRIEEKTSGSTATVGPVDDSRQEIDALDSWQALQKSGIKITSLDKISAELLKKKMAGWGCKKSKDKKQKKAYEQLVKRIKKLSR